MSITSEDVKKIAHLARLGLQEGETERFAEQISAILEYVEQLQKVDTKGIEPIAQITGIENALRDDEARPVDRAVRDELLKSAPATDGDLVKAKAVFE